MIAGVSPVPAYSFWDFALGTGILGGHMVTGRDQGETAVRNVIDFNVMQKYGIEVNELPEGGSVINRPLPLRGSYGWYIGAALLAISLESLLVVTLVLSLRQRKEALRMSGIARDLLEQRIEARTGELQGTNAFLEEEIRLRNRTQRVVTARLRLPSPSQRDASGPRGGHPGAGLAGLPRRQYRRGHRVGNKPHNYTSDDVRRLSHGLSPSQPGQGTDIHLFVPMKSNSVAR
jgi:hypothetical protein